MKKPKPIDATICGKEGDDVFLRLEVEDPGQDAYTCLNRIMLAAPAPKLMSNEEQVAATQARYARELAEELRKSPPRKNVAHVGRDKSGRVTFGKATAYEGQRWNGESKGKEEYIGVLHSDIWRRIHDDGYTVIVD